MLLNGKNYAREEYLRRVGIDTQAFGIRAMEYRSGDENLVKTFEVETGGGLSFSVGENKGMDIYRMSYRGINLGFMSKAGLHSAYNVEPESESFRYSQGCGMLYTAGITNVGGACRDDGGSYCYHGAIKNSAASQVTAKGEWRGDEYAMEISGELREAEFYGRNLVMRRSIQTFAGGKSFVLEDEIENRAFQEDQVMLLYHLNAGFPLLSDVTRMIAPVKSVRAATPRSEETMSEYAAVGAPIDLEEEYVYLLTLKQDAQGMTGSALWNDELGLGLYVKYDANTLNKFCEWKCLRSGDFALGMLPANCEPFGRLNAAKSGDWTALRPFQTMRTHLEIGVLDGKADLKSFTDWIETMK